MFNNTKKENNMLPNQDTQKNTSTTMGVRRPCFRPNAANDSFYHAAINAAKTRTYRAAVTAGLTTAEREDLYCEIRPSTCCTALGHLRNCAKDG